jgi:DNA polymerase-1
MRRLPEEIRKAGLSAKMLLQVHDELVLECDQGDLGKTAQIVQQVMEHAKNLPIPLSTEAKCGNNWGNLQPLHINPA